MYKASPSPHFRTAEELIKTISPEALQVFCYLLLRKDGEGKEPLLKPGNDHPDTKTYLRSQGEWEFPTENLALLATITHWQEYYTERKTLALLINLPLREVEAIKAALYEHPERQVLTEPMPPDQLLVALTPAAKKEDRFPRHPADGLDFDHLSEDADEPVNPDAPHPLSGISWMNQSEAVNGNDKEKFRWAS